ncbi:MAG: hypothetical protein MUE70_08430 [Desulfobacterales bacterium]|nr:hypothetical protein [Desulfobacterales bacterium]
MIAGWLAGPIWKHKRPIGVRGVYIAAVITVVAVALLDWYVIPAMGFSDSLRNLDVESGPFLGALQVLRIIRAAKNYGR